MALYTVKPTKSRTEFKRNSRELIFYTPSCGCLGVHISISLAVENTDLTNMYPV